MHKYLALQKRYQILIDIAIIFVSFILAGFIRFETMSGIVALFAEHKSLLGLSLLIRIPVYLIFGLYYRFGYSKKTLDLSTVTMANLASIALIGAINFSFLPAVGWLYSDSISIFLIDSLINLLLSGSNRLRHIHQRHQSSKNKDLLTEGLSAITSSFVRRNTEQETSVKHADKSSKTTSGFRNLLITGGAGFIGSNFVRYMLEKYPDYRIVVYDQLTYAGNLDNLSGLPEKSGDRYVFVQGDICDAELVAHTMELYRIDCLVNFAAETHVDRSLMKPDNFVQTNVFGTYILLEQARKYGVKRYHQISTDEVYGQILEGSFKETDPIDCRSPYSASKAGGDVMCLAYHNSFGLPVTISRGSNNVGPYQHVEKAVPLFVSNALDNLPLPVYGDGLYERDYQHVYDHCEAIDIILHRGQPGEIYNVGAGRELTALELAVKVCDLLGKSRSLIHFVKDRPGQDRRYSLDCSKLKALGWNPQHTPEQALEKTIHWYLENEGWWRKVKQGEYQEYYCQQYSERLRQATRASQTSLPIVSLTTPAT